MHLSLYLTIGSIDYYYWTSIMHANETELTATHSSMWVLDGFIFSTTGCGSGSFNSYLFIVEIVIYLVLILTVSIFVLFVKRDVWKVKTEVFAIFFNWAILGLAYCVSLFSDVSNL